LQYLTWKRSGRTYEFCKEFFRRDYRADNALWNIIREQESKDRDDESIVYYVFQVCALHENDSLIYRTQVGNDKIYSLMDIENFGFLISKIVNVLV
jgi:hypothetical protein